MIRSLAGEDFVRAPASRAVLAALTADGARARFVGGCVRNALLGLPVADIDIATTATPEAAMALITRAGLRAVPTGLDHGTITAIADHVPYEITTLRRDVETDGRRAVVQYTEDWAEDAHRRDFTINALYARADGTVIDLVGGLADLAARRVRFIGDPRARIAEDYLRILRFFRIHAWYGAGTPDAAGLAACAAMAGGLDRLSGERIAKEMLRLLGADDAAAAIAMMAAHGVLDHIGLSGADVARLGQLCAIDGAEGFAPDADLRLGALLPTPEAARAIAARWKLSNADAARLHAMLGAPPPGPADTGAALRRRLYREGPAPIADALRLAWAAEGPSADPAPHRARLAEIAAWTRPRLAVGGGDAAALGIAQGPEMGRVLDAVEAAWIDADFPSDPAWARAELARIVAAARD